MLKWKLILTICLIIILSGLTQSEELKLRQLEFVPTQFKITPEHAGPNMDCQLQVMVTHPPGTLNCNYNLINPYTQQTESAGNMFIINYPLQNGSLYTIPFHIGPLTLQDRLPYYMIRYDCSYFCVNKATHNISQTSYFITDPSILPGNILPFKPKTDFVKDNTQEVLNYISKTPEDQKVTLKEKLDELNSDKPEAEFYLQQSILLSNLFTATNCNNYKDLSNQCSENLKASQVKIIEKLEQVFPCETLQEKIFSSPTPERILTLSSLNLLFQTENPKTYMNNTLTKQNSLSECFTRKGFDFLVKLNQLMEKSKSLLDNVSNDYINSLIFTSSNNLGILKNNVYKNEKALQNDSLIVDNTTLGVKTLAEDNSLLLLKNNFTVIPENKFKTENLVYLSKKFKKTHMVGRNLQQNNNYEDILIANNKTVVNVSMPVDHMIDLYGLEEAKIGLILYEMYPLLEFNNKNYSESVVSVKLFDDKFENKEVKDLKLPINIVFKKPSPDYNFCLHFDPKNKTWSDQNCTAKNLTGDFLLCSCNHLTDFTISKFNPVYIYEDIINVLKDTNWMTDMEEFKNLNAGNAIVIYIYCFLIILFIIGMNFAIRHDLYVTTDYFFMDQSFRKKPTLFEKFCSFKRFVDEIVVLKTKTETKLAPRKKERVKEYLIENLKDENMVEEIKRKKTIQVRPAEINFRNSQINPEQSNRRVTVVNDKFKIDDEIEIDYDNIVENHQKSEIKQFKNNLYSSYQIESQSRRVSQVEVEEKDNQTDLERPLNVNTQDVKSEAESIEAKTIHSNAESNDTGKNVELDKIELKNEWLLKFTALLQIVQQYNLYTALVMKGDHVLGKANNLILIFFNISTSFAICGLFSPHNSISDSDKTTSEGYTFTNRGLAVSIIVLFLMHIPTKIMSLLLKKTIIYKGNKVDKPKRRLMSIITHSIIYLIMMTILIWCILNTQWIYLRNGRIKRSNVFLFYFFAYLLVKIIMKVLLFVLKSLLCYSIIKDSEVPKWKKVVIPIGVLLLSI